MFPESSNCPSDTNGAYYSTNTDIKNHIYTAKRAQQLSKVDQDNLKLKIGQWKAEKCHHCSTTHLTETETEDGDCCVSDEYSGTFSQTLLYVHQKWQQHLLSTHVDMEMKLY